MHKAQNKNKEKFFKVQQTTNFKKKKKKNNPKQDDRFAMCVICPSFGHKLDKLGPFQNKYYSKKKIDFKYITKLFCAAKLLYLHG